MNSSKPPFLLPEAERKSTLNNGKGQVRRRQFGGRKHEALISNASNTQNLTVFRLDPSSSFWSYLAISL